MRKTFLTLYTLVFALVFTTTQAAKRPNILLCISDDQSYADTGAAHNRVIKTPAFDRVAREGISSTLSATPPPAGHHEARS